MGTQELIIIFLIVFLLFGATRLPQLGSSLGSAIRNFKKGFNGEEEAHPSPPADKKLAEGGAAPSITQDDKTAQKQG